MKLFGGVNKIIYLCTMKNKTTKIISIGWGQQERFLEMGKLIQKNKAKLLYYSCDKFYYEVHRGFKA